jgi:membrane protein DedA with SNARE-associated domain
LSAWTWAAITIVPVWYFGEEILELLKQAKQYWYIAIPLVLVIGGTLVWYFNKATKK